MNCRRYPRTLHGTDAAFPLTVSYASAVEFSRAPLWVRFVNFLFWSAK